MAGTKRIDNPANHRADVAQLVEQLTRNEQVVRSNRIVGSIYVCPIISGWAFGAARVGQDRPRTPRSSSSHLFALKTRCEIQPEKRHPRLLLAASVDESHERTKDFEPARIRP